jgi:hypothetical protein
VVDKLGSWTQFNINANELDNIVEMLKLLEANPKHVRDLKNLILECNNFPSHKQQNILFLSHWGY